MAAAAEKLLCALVPRHEIAAKLTQTFVNLSKRQARRYVADAEKRLQQAGDVRREERKALLRGTLEQLLRQALGKGQLRIAREVVADLIKLDGLAEPDKSELKVLGLDLEAGRLTSATAIRERLAELRAKDDEPDALH